MLVIFKNYLFDPESEYLLVADEVFVSKSGQKTYGLDCFCSSLYGKSIPGLSFLGMSLVSIKDRRSYPMMMEQILRSNESANPDVSATVHQNNIGSRNRKIKDVTLINTLKQLQTMVKSFLQQTGDCIKLRYLFLMDISDTIMLYSV